MNERTIELYREASEFAYKICREEGRDGGTSDHIWNMLSTGKFAELIVRECAEWVNDNLGLVDEEARKDLLRHFGVE